MKYQTTPAFLADVRRLSQAERELFGKVVREEFVPAAERRAANPAAPWPKKLRVKSVRSAPGIWEVTYSGPDGRATFEWTTVGGKPAILWRRVGGHEIFSDPAGKTHGRG